MFRILLAFSMGAFSVVGFSPFNWWPAVVLSVVGFLLVIVSSTKHRVFLLGWSYGLGLFGFGVGWIQVSIHQFGIPSYFFSYGMTALLVMFLALYFGLFATLLRLSLNHGFHLIIAAPILWVLTEYIRGRFFSGFPWLSVGYSQIDGPLNGYVPFIGTLGCSFILILVCSLLAATFKAKKLSVVYFVSIIGTIVLLGVILRFYESTESIGSPLSVVLVQGAIPQEIKWHPDIRQPSIQRYKSISAKHWDADIIIWPETAIPAFRNEVLEELQELTSLSKSTETDLLIGMPRISDEDGRTFNSIALLDGSLQVYDKQHLVPFGEYLPLEPYLGWLINYLNIPMSEFSSGISTQPLLEVSGYKIGVSICYESVFSNLINKGLPEAGFLVNLSNDAWFGDSIGPHQNLQIARMRALESGRYLLRSTNNGLTAIISDKGDVLGQAPQFVPTYLRGHVQPKTGSTFYIRFGDRPLVYFTCFLLVFNLFFPSKTKPLCLRRRPYY